MDIHETSKATIRDIPQDAPLALTAVHTINVKGTCVFGHLVCDHIRLYDQVFVVIESKAWIGRVFGILDCSIIRQPPIELATLGQNIGLNIRGWVGLTLPPSVQIYRLPESPAA